jgi:type IV secretory pathway VirB2 component (pilin)
MLVIVVIGIGLLFGSIMYNHHLKDKCVAAAISANKSADDIKKICYER